jgi:cation diffusion facilitator family transporter
MQLRRHAVDSGSPAVPTDALPSVRPPLCLPKSMAAGHRPWVDAVPDAPDHATRPARPGCGRRNPGAITPAAIQTRVMGSSRSVVMAALVANGAIAVLKFVGFLLTGSAAMLSETYHSISDTGNQVFLLIGIRYSERRPDDRHPFGYGKAQFFYAFLVSVLLFGIAGWESAKHGYTTIRRLLAAGGAGGHGGGGTEPIDLLLFSFDPATVPIDGLYVNYGVLVGAIVFEAYAFVKARAEIRRQMERHDWATYREAFRRTSDVTTLTALTEDSIAMGGAGIALFGVFLEQQTGDPIYDAIAALLIGFLLMGFALALAWENKRLILGESLPRVEEDELQAVVETVEGVDRVVDFRTVFFGPQRIVVTADIDFERGLETGEIDAVIDAIEAALAEIEPNIRTVYIEVEEDDEGSVDDGLGG